MFYRCSEGKKNIGNGHQAGGNFSKTRKLFPEKSIKEVCFLSINTNPDPYLAFKL